VQRLAEALTVALRVRAIVRIQSPLALLGDSEPEPDIAVVPLGNYSTRHPAEALLVVEISGSSLQRDRLVKGPIYARAGVEEFWLIDLAARVVEVHRDPDGGGFTSIVRVAETESLRPLRFPGVEVSVQEVLPTVRR
jgi:Uma2 family endonuclease